jgi:drug/metabolite transporter (DMT)-like permease
MNIFKKSKNYLLLHFIVFIWGFAGVFGRGITLPTTHLIWFRLLIASFAIFIFLVFKGIPLKAKRTELWKFMGIGLLIAIHWICFYGAIKVSNISVTLACFSCGALFTALLEPLFFKKKLNWIEIACGLMVIIAISMIFSFEAKYKLGMMLSIAAAFMSAVFTVLNSILVKTSDSRVLSFYEMVFGFIGITVFLLLTNEFHTDFFVISSKNWFLLILFGLVGTAFTFVISSEILKEISAYTVNLTVNLEVVYGIILAYLIFGEDERMTFGFYMATFIILLVLFANALLKQKQERPSL